MAIDYTRLFFGNVADRYGLRGLSNSTPLGQGGILPITFLSLMADPVYNGQTINLGSGTTPTSLGYLFLMNKVGLNNLQTKQTVPVPEVETSETHNGEATVLLPWKDRLKNKLGNINYDALRLGLGLGANTLANVGAVSGNMNIATAGNVAGSLTGVLDTVKNWKSAQLYTEDAKAAQLKALAGFTDPNSKEAKAAGLAAYDDAISAAKLGNTASAFGAAGGVADAARGFFAKYHANDSALTSGLNTGYDAISSAMMGFAPVGTIVGGAMKVGALVGDAMTAMGVGTDQMTKADQILDSNFMKLTPTGLINAGFAKKTDSFAVNDDVMAQVGGDYEGTASTIMSAADKAGKKYGLFSSKKRKLANADISKARAFLNKMGQIADNANDMRLGAQSTSLNNYLRYLLNLNGGIGDYSFMAKQGGQIKLKLNIDTKLIEDEWIPVITEPIDSFKNGGVLENDWEPAIELFHAGGIIDEWEPTIELFKEGGTVTEESAPLTTLKNVIPDGALHKNKHHMENADGLTKKGIPVIDNDGEQLAEIELNEIIFSLEVTKRLESLYKSFIHYDTSLKEKDELAIEAGKLLVQEILFNTEDNTGLIDTLKNGGKING